MRTEVEKRLQKQRELVEEQKTSDKLQKQLLKDVETFNEKQPSGISNWLSNKQNKLNTQRSNRANELINDWIKQNGQIDENNYSKVQSTVERQLNKEFRG